MISPLKLSIEQVPSWARSWLPCIHNPRRLVTGNIPASDFSTVVSTVKIGRTWRSTGANRHTESQKLVAELAKDLGRDAVILDIGASDGTTSLDQIAELGDSFHRYYVTDRTSKIAVRERGESIYFYDPESHTCILYASPTWIAYPATAESLFPLAQISKHLLGRAPAYDEARMKWVSMTRPEVLALAERDARVVVREHDVFDCWDGELVHIAKVANVLNADYFPPDQIRAALARLAAALVEGGCILTIDNRGDLEHSPSSRRAQAPTERYSLLRKRGTTLQIEREFHGGTDAARVLKSA